MLRPATAGSAVALYDPRTDPEPDGWETLRRRARLRANWAWPVLRAGVLSSPEPVLIAVVSGTAGPAGLFAASVVPLRRRTDRPAPPGWPAVGYLHVQAPQSSAVPGFWFAAPQAPDGRGQVVREFRRACRRALGPGLAGVLWRQLGEADAGWLPRLRYRRDTEPLAVLDAPPSTDAWLAGLGRGRRHDLRRIRRALARDPSVVVATGPVGTVAAPAELAGLARLNFAKHTGADTADARSGPRSEAWQAALAGRPDVHTVAYRDDTGRLLAAGTVLDDEAWPLWLSWGALPVEDGGRRHLYFDLFCRLVDRVVERGAEGIVLGKGMAALKADLGARLVPQAAAVTR